MITKSKPEANFFGNYSVYDQTCGQEQKGKNAEVGEKNKHQIADGYEKPYPFFHIHKETSGDRS